LQRGQTFGGWVKRGNHRFRHLQQTKIGIGMVSTLSVTFTLKLYHIPAACQKKVYLCVKYNLTPWVSRAKLSRANDWFFALAVEL
jgi:hypothetical protein